MDHIADLPEVERQHDERSSFRELGLSRLTPIDPQDFTRIAWLWERVKTQDYAFDDFCRGDLEIFTAGFLDPGALHFTLGDSGYVVVRNLRYSDNPSLHYSVWDRGLAFKEILKAGREIIDFLFKRLKIARISAPVPTYNRQAAKFATLLGFKYEGLVRQGILYFEHHYDIELYGLLRDEWERGKVERR